MGIIGWCGVAILSAVLILVLRRLQSELVPFLSLSACVLLCAGALLTLSPFFRFLIEWSAQNDMAQQGRMMLKIFGIGTLTALCCDICREMGEGAVANQLEMLSRAEVLVLLLPFLKDILTMSAEWLL